MADSRVHELLSGLTVALRNYDNGGALKKARNKLSEKMDESRFLVSSSPQVIIYTRRHDGDCRATFMSENVLSQLGYRPEEFIEDASFWADRIHLEDAPFFFSELSALLKTGHHVHEYRFLHKDGTWRRMRDELNLVRDGAGRPAEILGSWMDITEHKRAEEALLESEAQYRSLVETAPVGMVSFDNRGEITEFNPALLSILGAPDFEATEAKDLFSLLPLVEAGISEAILQCLQSGESGVGEFQYNSKVGREVYTRVHVVPIRGSDGSVAGAHAFLQDLSDQKRAEELIVRSERLKVLGQMATGVAHIFNNLLQIVSGHVNMALTNLLLQDREGVRVNLEQILESARGSTEAVRWLQQFGRERPHDAPPRSEVFDLADTVIEAVEMSKLWSKVELERLKIQVTVDLDLSKGCYVEGVQDQIAWVVLNLLKNAVEALPHGGKIRLRTFIKGDQVVLEVQDNGVGIPPENIKHITTAFWTSKEYHAGMGLTFNSGIISQHKGSMGVKRLKPKGTTLVVRLPYVPDPSQTRKALAAAAADSGLRILLIDDDEPVVRVFEEGLRLLGQTPLPASSAKQGLKMLEEMKVDAVVCELSLSDMNGWEMARAVRQFCLEKDIPKPPFIILSGFARQLDNDEIRSHPEVDRILDKPIRVSRLIDAIGEEIKKRSATAAFSGRVDGVDLLEYLQLLLLNRQRGVLEILSRDGVYGFLFLDSGDISHATCGDFEGEEALFRCMTFKGGSFAFLPWREPDKVTIEKPGQFMLIEAARKRDEMRDNDDTAGGPGTERSHTKTRSVSPKRSSSKGPGKHNPK